MALNIFQQYGIKEVANVYFEALAADPINNVKVGDIVLFLDTLKVSTIEQTAENTEAKGGWGNPSLIMWDYGKEINLTLEDALITMESLRFMLGGAIKEAAASGGELEVHRTAEIVIGTANTLPTTFEDDYGNEVESADITKYKVLNLTTGSRSQVDGDGQNLTAAKGDKLRIFWTEQRDGTTGKEAVQITISPSTFPGTYKVLCDTLIRDTNGDDSPFQFVINKAKVNSEVTLTMQAEGDPSTFEMTLRVLRDGKEMMSLIKM